MICVACNNRDSLENVRKWKSEIETVEPKKPMILILTKSDLKDNVDMPIKLAEL